MSHLGNTIWLCAFLHVLSHGTSHAASTVGKEFIVAFLTDFNTLEFQDHSNDIYISSPVNTTCSIDYDDGVRTKMQVAVPGPEVTLVSLPDATQVRLLNEIVNKGIYISCSSDVSVYVNNRHVPSGPHRGSYGVLPLNALSHEYIIPGINNNPLLGVAAFGPNDTSIEFHVRSTCDVTFNNHTFTNGDVIKGVLTNYDVLQFLHGTKLDIAYNCDLGGSYIWASNPIAVFSGSPYYYLHDDLALELMLQVPPFSMSSKKVIVPHVPRPSSFMGIRVVGMYNATQVSITPLKPGASVQPGIQLHRGEFHEFGYSSDADVLIESTKPILVVQNSYFTPLGGMSMFVPGVDAYLKDYVIKTMITDVNTTGTNNPGPTLTIISKTSEKGNVRINGQAPAGIKWLDYNTASYSVGTMQIQDDVPYSINSVDPIYIRLHDYVGANTYGFTGGYQDTTSVTSSTSNIKDAISLQCLQTGWEISIDLSKLTPRPADVSHIYMGRDSCIGILNGDILVFNMTYDACDGKTKVVKDDLVTENFILYTVPSSDGVVRDIIWRYDVSCAEAINESGGIHIYPDHSPTNHVATSGHLASSAFSIHLYKDSQFHTPFIETQHKAQLGQPLYVQITAPSNRHVIMVVKACHAHLTNDPAHSISHALIRNSCPVDKETQILAVRDQVMRFKFSMFDLPNEKDGLYVTCDVKFCTEMDFSPECQLGCSRPIVG